MKHRPFSILLTLALVLGMGVLVSCSKPSEQAETPPSDQGGVSPLEQVQIAVSQERYADADVLVRKLLAANPSDVEVLQIAADIAFANNRASEAVDLMVEASTSDQFKNETLANRAVIGLITLGRLYDAIKFLEPIVEKYPERHALRRYLFDFLVNIEESHRATPHGRYLVRQRQFDRVLLFSLSTYEQRDLEAGSMATLHKRNPSDCRLRIAEVRTRFDRGLWDGIEEPLDEILKQYPDNVAAQLLFGQYLIASGQYDRLDKWSGIVGEEAKDTWQYWATLGDYASHRSQHKEAVRAYWEAARRNLDHGEIFTRLGRSMLILQQEGEAINPSDVEAVNARAELLVRFMQDKERFYKLGNTSNAIVVDVARSLVELGRLWEAEAWLAFAMTIPDDDVAKVQAYRGEVVKLLTSETPWQLEAGHPVVSLDLSGFPVPRIESSQDALVESGFSAPSVTPVLVDEAQERGLVKNVSSSQATSIEGIPLYAQMESGGCAVDYDLDGWPDIYIAYPGGKPGENNSRPNQLFRNLHGHFAEVTDLAGAFDQGFAQGVTFGDVNEDGFHDIVVMNYGKDRLLINNGDGTFSDRSQWLDTGADVSWSTSGALADINQDGITDFVCLKYCAGMNAVEIPCHDPETNEVSPCLPTKFAAERDSFYVGTPEGGFREVTDAWSAVPGQMGRGLGVVIGALDTRPGLDVFVANDMTANHFWSPSGNDEFSLVESATLRGLAFEARGRPQACMGVATADLDDDGDIDFFVTNFEEEHNTFYEQTHQGVWTDTTQALGLMQASFSLLGFGCQAIDFDNDSNLEVAIANGHVYKDVEPPITYKQKMQIIRRAGDKRYELFDLSASKGYLSRPHVGRGLWWMDADRDGRNDMAITHQGEPFALLMNRTETEHGWLRVELVGVSDTRDPIGATVQLTAGGKKKTAPLVSGDGFYCANQRMLHFGLGNFANDETPIEMSIAWPNGDIQEVGVRPGGHYVIVQGQEAFRFAE